MKILLATLIAATALGAAVSGAQAQPYHHHWHHHHMWHHHHHYM